jgi:hypothetical protein
VVRLWVRVGAQPLSLSPEKVKPRAPCLAVSLALDSVVFLIELHGLRHRSDSETDSVLRYQLFTV